MSDDRLKKDIVLLHKQDYDITKNKIYPCTYKIYLILNKLRKKIRFIISLLRNLNRLLHNTVIFYFLFQHKSVNTFVLK